MQQKKNQRLGSPFAQMRPAGSRSLVRLVHSYLSYLTGPGPASPWPFVISAIRVTKKLVGQKPGAKSGSALRQASLRLLRNFGTALSGRGAAREWPAREASRFGSWRSQVPFASTGSYQ